MVICLERGADLHMAQLMPLPLTISCSSKSRLVLPEWFCFSGTGLPRLSWKKRLLNECSSSSSSSSSSKSMTHSQCDVRPTVTFRAIGHQCRVTGTKLQCLVIEAWVCELLAQGCYPRVEWPGFEPAIFESQVQHPNYCATISPDKPVVR